MLATNPERINNAFLDGFEGFREWRARASAEPVTGNQANDEPGPTMTRSTEVQGESGQTPEDAMASALKMMNAALRDDLLALLQTMSRMRSERLILDLLAAMGYGGGDISNGRMTRATGDGGIDGVKDEDALGLDAVYIQAKRYDPSYKVGRPPAVCRLADRRRSDQGGVCDHLRLFARRKQLPGKGPTPNSADQRTEAGWLDDPVWSRRARPPGAVTPSTRSTRTISPRYDQCGPY